MLSIKEGGGIPLKEVVKSFVLISAVQFRINNKQQDNVLGLDIIG